LTPRRWLGMPWPAVKAELEQKRIPYEMRPTCAPRRAPWGDDVRVLKAVEGDDGLVVTTGSFSTAVAEERQAQRSEDRA
jgi:hypothetical protein